MPFRSSGNEIIICNFHKKTAPSNDNQNKNRCQCKKLKPFISAYNFADVYKNSSAKSFAPTIYLKTYGFRLDKALSLCV